MARAPQNARPQPVKVDRDVAVLLRTHKALWENVGELHHIIGLLAGQVFLKDKDLHFIYVNDEFAREHGMTPQEMIGKDDYDLFPPAEAEGYRADDRRVFQSGQVTFVTNPAWPAVKVPIKDSKGETVAIAVLTSWSDTKQRIAERLFHYASVVLCSADAIIGLDMNGVVQSWNPGAESMYGYEPMDVVGRPIADLSAPDCRTDLTEQLEQASAASIVRDYEATHLRKNGTPLSVSVTLSPMVGVYRPGGGRVHGGAGRDGTQAHGDGAEGHAGAAGGHSERIESFHVRGRAAA